MVPTKQDTVVNNKVFGIVPMSTYVVQDIAREDIWDG